MSKFHKISALLFLTLPILATAQQTELPWLKNINAQGKLTEIEAIRADANVSVSDGTSFSTISVFHDRQRAIHRQIDEGRTTTMGVEGRYMWIYDGQTEKEAPPFVADLVLGHQIHALVLFFDRLYSPLDTPKTAQFAGEECVALASQNDPWTFYYERNGRPVGMEMKREGEPPVTFRFSDWRTIDEMLLPFAVLIDDGSNQFQYKYSEITINKGSISEFRAPEAVLTDEQKLLRLHRIFMDGHLFGEVAEMSAAHGDSVVIVGRGDVHEMPGEQSAATLGDILARSNYSVYDDMIRPKVEISEDGSLGWVIAQVLGKGVDNNSGNSFEFVCAWIELYKKTDGKWRFTGNVSNFRPEKR